MKLPNGYGSVTKLPGNRRKPYLARLPAQSVYDEKLDDYVIKRPPLGYYKTQKEALFALAQYNDNPFKITDSDLTFAKAYQIYLNSKDYEKLGKSTKTARRCGYAYCEKLYDLRIRDINKDMVVKVLDAVDQGSSTKTSVLTVIRVVEDYAFDRNIINKRFTEKIKIEYSEPTFERIPFSDSEIDILWAHSEKWDVKVLLILLYSGLRVNELLKNFRENVNLEERWIYVPKELAKTIESERKVPIHDKIYDLVKYFYDLSESFDKKELMVNPNGSIIMYNNFVSRNLQRINKLFLQVHRFHDTRHTFSEITRKAGIEELYRQKLMGHKPRNELQKTYTHITIEELQEELKKVK